MTGWEYRTVNVKTSGVFIRRKVDEGEIDRLLNAMGLDGWELVTAITRTENGYSMELLYTFKRPLS